MKSCEEQPFLPAHGLEAEEVVEQGLVTMSLYQFYRATRERQFYSTWLKGKNDGRVYPAWQFVDPVPAILPQVLRVLSKKRESQIHERMMTAEEALHGWSPAEVLAGRPFQARDDLCAAQHALLELSSQKRLALVIGLLEHTSRATAIG